MRAWRRSLARVLPLALAAGLASAAGPPARAQEAQSGRLASSEAQSGRLASSPGAEGAFDRVLRGDVAAAAAGVTACPHAPGMGCDSSSAYGQWADGDGRAGTYNAGSARLAVPDGASVEHALLVWAGSAAAGPRSSPTPDGACVAGGRVPAGSPETAPVRLRVAGRGLDVGADRFDRGRAGAGRWYGAAADVTAAFAGVHGPVTVTVGNVWTPEGRGCSGGWAVLAAWEDGRAPLRRVVVGAASLAAPPGAEAALAPPGLRVAGGDVAVTVAAFEGDGAAGDAVLEVGGRALAGGFAWPAEARRVAAGPAAVPAGSRSVRVGLRSTDDVLLLGGLAVSAPLAALEVTTTAEPAQLMEGQEYEQAAVVRNAGGVPLEEVRLTFGPPPGCAHDLPPLPPGAAAEAGCTRLAAARQTEATATAVATTPDGRAVAAGDAAGLRVLQVAPAVVRTAKPRVLPRAVREAEPEPVVVPPAPAPAPAPAPEAEPAPRAAKPTPAPTRKPKPPPEPEPAPPEIVVEAQGPLDSPARTAAVIAVLGVFVMTVSVGAFGAALKPRPR